MAAISRSFARVTAIRSTPLLDCHARTADSFAVGYLKSRWRLITETAQAPFFWVASDWNHPYRCWSRCRFGLLLGFRPGFCRVGPADLRQADKKGSASNALTA